MYVLMISIMEVLILLLSNGASILLRAIDIADTAQSDGGVSLFRLAFARVSINFSSFGRR
jgi:hypothetical protein